MDFLEIRNLTKSFGGLTAVMDLDLSVPHNQIFGLIGPNGAGKSTALNMIDGTLMSSEGEIIFKGEKITKFSPHKRARRGIARVFQDNLFFSSFTVIDNVIAGYYLQSKIDLARIFLRTRTYVRQEKILEDKARETLQFVGLAQYADEPAINLPHGRQRLLCLAVALGTQPQLLLLDEPLTGMNAEEVENMLSMVRSLREKKEVIK